MIQLPFKDQEARGYDFSSPNAYVDLLDQWERWFADLGFKRLLGGSMRSHVDVGHWTVQSFKVVHGVPADGIWGRRLLCLNEADRKMAILFKLTWL